MLVCEQVNRLVLELLVMVAVGAEISCVMMLFALAVQPFAAVTVTVYVPGELTASVAAVPTTAVPFDQLYAVPPVAVKLIEVVVQLSILTFGKLVIFTLGAVVFWVMVVLAVDEQPFGAVTVTV